ncbi:sensor histidine kinase [Halalkalibacter flavus]|uniref:sensor histidine kinase n=1 Tax=Halalkalibacter flavus TaxID=3090668 RepID=UPI002FCA6422
MINKLKRTPFIIRMMCLIGVLIVITLLILGVFLNHQYAESIEEQMGLRALSVAQSVSAIPEIIEAFEHDQPELVIQPIAEYIRLLTGAEFIVVGSKEGIRYSHPIDGRIGQKMVGGDNEKALLYGESYVSKAIGSLGPSIRGKVPIINESGNIVGLVSVGFLMEDLRIVIKEHVMDIWLIVLGLMGFGMIGAYIISYQLKKEIHGLEPEEIGRLFEEKEAILQSIHEGVIAVNDKGKVTMYNQTAKRIMVKKDGDGPLIGRHITEVLPKTKLHEVLKFGEKQLNQELWIEDELVIVNRVPILSANKVVGAVSSFRDRKEILQLSDELSKVKEYSDALRAQTHEFANKLNIISGLLQLGKNDEAVLYIQKESKFQQQMIHFLIERVQDPIISAVLLGKLNQALELGIKMEIEESSSLLTKLTEKQQEALGTVLGNLLDNAFDALMEACIEEPYVFVSFMDVGKELIFEIEDNGRGIPLDRQNDIFEKGYSTKKGRHRGFGLALVRESVESVHGEIMIEQGVYGGACFVVIIPKEETR